jgi:outer membrane immunogenic protein
MPRLRRSRLSRSSIRYGTAASSTSEPCARVGYAWDRLLAFATGGFAYGGGGCGFFHDCDGTRYGWVAGGGLEYAVLDNLSVKLEGLYVNLRDDGGGTVAGTAIPYARDSAGVTYFAPASAFGVARRQGDSFIVARVGVNYRFSFGR